ncbi:MAG: endonuclease NucS [Methanobacterium sp.]|nr:endonuclease NucS [Methanobacterium sp.]
MDSLKEHNGNLRGIIVAPSITNSAMKLLKKYNLEFKELYPPKELKKEVALH